jgi:hypothetical protein
MTPSAPRAPFPSGGDPGCQNAPGPLVSSPPITFSRLSAGLAVVLVLGLAFGCMSFQLGGNRDDGMLVQEGEVPVPANQEISVYYATPYASVPELTTYWSDRCVVTDQKENHFSVRNNGGTVHKLNWRARGPAAVAPIQERGPRRLIPRQPDLQDPVNGETPPSGQPLLPPNATPAANPEIAPIRMGSPQ